MRDFPAKNPPTCSHKYPYAMETVAGGEFDVESLCQEYVNGQSTSEAPKLLARGT